MAHAIVHRSCTKLRSAIRDEAIMRRKFTGDLEEILAALEEIQPDLDEAERQSWWRAAVRNWLMQVRKAGYDIWDMVDELQQETSSAAGKMTRMRRRLSVVSKKKNSTMAIKLKDLKVKLKTLQEESVGFHFRRLDASVPDRLDERDTAPQIDEAKVFGRDGDKEMIMLVLSESDFSEGPIILPIYGLDGVGKTTLAAMVFNNTRFEGYSRVWIHVSQEFDLHKIGKSIIFQVSEEQINHDSNEMEYIIERLHELLSSRKVLIVLHDLWDEDSRELQSLKRMLSAADKGSQVIVIVTVRNVRIASEICTTQPYRLRPLSDDTCWEIIKQTSCFADRSQSDIEKLKQTRWRIAGKCGGLPSAAKEIGRMLKFQDGKIWEEMSRLQCQFEPEESFYSTTSMDSLDSTSPIELLDSTLPVELLHSTSPVEFLEPLLSEPSEPLPTAFREFFSSHHIYINMPPYLRLCFAYCAIFSGDATINEYQEIVKDDLIHQWIALDLIEPSDRFSAKQLGERYFKTLLGMSLLGTKKRNLTDQMYDMGEDMFTQQYPVNYFVSYIIGDDLIIMDGRGETSPQKEHCRYAVIPPYTSELPLTFPAQLRALHCRESSFSFTSLLRVLKLNEGSLQRLPASVYKLTQLRYLNLSGCSGLVALLETVGDLINLVYMDLSSCSGLVKLPESLGNLTNLVHMDISGCSRLVELPRSFGKLINLEHVNFSGCCGLANLPESFGDLRNLLHVDLSRCSQLENLLQLSENLKNLVYLDLSFWSCLKGISVLGGLTNLQHLNLSHPCCYVAEHSSHLEGLPAALGKLNKLQCLNLSMFLNPIFYYKSEYQRREYIKSCINGLYNLKHLDLSHNIFLSEIPESISDLSKLHTLDLSGCARLKIEAKWMDENKPLKLILSRSCPGPEIYQFVVRSNDGAHRSSNLFSKKKEGSSNLVELGDVDCEQLEISCLEKVKSRVEAQRMRLAEKQKLRKLKLCWTVGSQQSVKNNALLEELVPPHDLEWLEIHGYNGETWHTSWMLSLSSDLTSLADVTMEDIPRCSRLPPLDLLPNLQRLVLRRMDNITRIDVRYLFDGNRSHFPQLSKVTLDEMEHLEEIMFLGIDELVIHKCPELSFGPLPPRARKLLISDCDRVMSSWGNIQGEGVEGEGPSTPVTELVVESCKVPLGDWTLLQNLPGLCSLTIKSCYDLTSSLESIQILSSIETLHFSHCDNMKLLPAYLGNLTTLQQLKIESCKQLSRLPQNIQKLTNLKLKDVHISDCPELEKWCELGENKKKFAHFLRKSEISTPSPFNDWIVETPFNGQYPWSPSSSESDFMHTR